MKKIKLIGLILLIALLTHCEKNNKDLNNTVEDIDGNVYKTVQIGDQLWMAENLKTTKYSDGTEIPFIENHREWINLRHSDTTKAYTFYYDGIEVPYGAYYTWQAATNNAINTDTNSTGIQGVCPEGWHLPSDSEWKNLLNYISKNNNNVLKSQNGWDDNNNGSDIYGFSALPGGYITNSTNVNIFQLIGNYAVWWINSEINETRAYTYYIGSDSTDTYRSFGEKLSGHNVRCLKN